MQLRKKEGEHLNYKKFEPSDDVRRIVWKIFAKNRELVVRMPELDHPFTSHLELYASYFTTISPALFYKHTAMMLNEYKQAVWSIYEQLKKEDVEVHYMADQYHAPAPQHINPVRYQITNSIWHQNKPVSDFVQLKTASVICLHSLSSADDVRKLLQHNTENLLIIFVPLDKVFQRFYLIHWITRMFIKPPDDQLNQLRSTWYFHPLNRKLKQNAAQLLTILEDTGIPVKVIS
jgi:hypothetical protein